MSSNVYYPFLRQQTTYLNNLYHYHLNTQQTSVIFLRQDTGKISGSKKYGCQIILKQEDNDSKEKAATYYYDY